MLAWDCFYPETVQYRSNEDIFYSAFIFLTGEHNGGMMQPQFVILDHMSVFQKQRHYVEHNKGDQVQINYVSGKVKVCVGQSGAHYQCVSLSKHLIKLL